MLAPPSVMLEALRSTEAAKLEPEVGDVAVALATTTPPWRTSKRTLVTPPGAVAVAVACTVVPTKALGPGLVRSTLGCVTSLQTLFTQAWREGQAGVQPPETTWQTPATQVWPWAQAGKQCPCGSTDTCGICVVRQMEG